MCVNRRRSERGIKRRRPTTERQGSMERVFSPSSPGGVEKFLSAIREELLLRTYKPSKNQGVEIPKGNGKTRRLGIPTIKDRVVQGAVKLILEAIFEADFHTSSFAYRAKRTAHQALDRVEIGRASC